MINRILVYNGKEYLIYSSKEDSLLENRQGRYLHLGTLTVKTETIYVKDKKTNKIVWINKQDIYKRYDGVWHPLQDHESYTERKSFYENDDKIKSAIDYFNINNSIEGLKEPIDVSFLDKKENQNPQSIGFWSFLDFFK